MRRACPFILNSVVVSGIIKEIYAVVCNNASLVYYNGVSRAMDSDFIYSVNGIRETGSSDNSDVTAVCQI